MRQFVTIAVNAFMELVRQPVYLLLMTSSGGFSVFLAAVPYFGFGDDPKMVMDMTLAVMLLSGLLGAVLCASSSVAQEIRLGTVLTVMAKPVSRTIFLLGKYTGLAATLVLLSFTNLVAALLASRMAYDAYGSADVKSLGIYFGAGLLGYAAAGFMNFFLRRPFVVNAVFGFSLLTTLVFCYIAFFTTDMRSFGEVAAVDWRMLPAGVLILFALLLLAAIALACSTRLETVPTLAVCSAVFFLGLISDYLFGNAAGEGAMWAQISYALVPNWSQFWMADALEPEKTIPWFYVVKAGGYMIAYLGIALVAALLLFEERELN